MASFSAITLIFVLTFHLHSSIAIPSAVALPAAAFANGKLSEQASGEIYINKLYHGAVFKKTGKVFTSLAYAHIHIPIRISGILKRKQKIHDIKKEVDNWPIGRIKDEDTQVSIVVLRDWLDQKVAHTNARIEALLQTLGHRNETNRRKRDIDAVPTAEPRDKRQILMGIGGAIVGGFITSIVSSFKQSTLIDIIKKKQNVMATQIEDNLIKTNQNTEDLKKLTKALEMMRVGISDLFNTTKRMRAHSQMMHLLTVVNENTQLLNNLIAAVEEARGGKFSLGLCEPQGLAAALEELQNEGLKDGRTLGVDSILDLPHMPVSYLVEVEAQILHVLLHLPMQRSGAYLNLLHFVDSPLHTIGHNSTRPLYVEVNLKGMFLAIAVDQSKYMIYSDDDLRACHSVRNHYYCPDLVVYKETRKSCIRAIYENDANLVHKMCPLTVTTEVSKATRLNATTYIVTETKPQELTITCTAREFIKKQTISGTYEVNIQKGCIMTTDNLIIDHPNFEPEIEIEGILQTTPMETENWVPREDMHDFTIAAKTLLDHIGEKVPLHSITALAKFKKHIQEAEREDWEEWISHAGPGGLASSVFTIIIVVIVMVLIAKLVSCMNTRRTQGLSIIPIPFRRNPVNPPVVRMNDLNEEISREEERAEDYALMEEERRRRERKKQRRMEKQLHVEPDNDKYPTQKTVISPPPRYTTDPAFTKNIPTPVNNLVFSLATAANSPNQPSVNMTNMTADAPQS